MAEIVDGELITDDKDEIEQRLRAALRAEFGDDIDLTDGSVFATLAAPYAKVLAGEIQNDLSAVYDASFLETASDENLEKVVSLIGLSRLSATNATGVVTFDHGEPTDSDITVPNGTTVTTGGTSPIAFDTTESVSVDFYDSFEAGTYPTGWTGDTGQFQRDTVFATDGSNSLKCPGGSAGGITFDGSVTSRGTTVECDLYFEGSGASPDKGGIVYMATIAGDQTTGYRVLVDASNNELQLWSPGSQQTFTSATIPTDEQLHVRVTSKVNGDHVAELEDSSGTVITTASWSETLDTNSTYEGLVGLQANNGEVSFDFLAESAVSADIRAVEAGSEGNIGANQLSVMPSPVSGINDVFNRFAVGDTDLFDTDGDLFTAGTNEETDTQLRERARRLSGEGGGASVNELLSAVRRVDNVTSIALFENASDADNTGSGGLPPVSFEMVVNGGDSFEIGEAIFETQAATARDYSGAYGTSVTESIEAINGQTFDTKFSRPSVVAVDATIDIVHTSEYAGNAAVKDAIVDYVGGVDTNGEPVSGTETGENVRIDEVEDRVMDVEGVQGIDSGGTSYTPSTTTDANGLEVISIADNEVGEVDGTDGSITVTTTEV
jgi:hypothetical protein